MRSIHDHRPCLLRRESETINSDLVPLHFHGAVRDSFEDIMIWSWCSREFGTTCKKTFRQSSVQKKVCRRVMWGHRQGCGNKIVFAFFIRKLMPENFEQLNSFNPSVKPGETQFKRSHWPRLIPKSFQRRFYLSQQGYHFHEAENFNQKSIFNSRGTSPRYKLASSIN